MLILLQGHFGSVFILALFFFFLVFVLTGRSFVFCCMVSLEKYALL